ncbi:MAG: WhiB family transcriptional regulator [Hyphomicrobiaceae bacterium]|nr:MAG: WhiB family transcriptional regulator [Hyphomicrobiaceae bacterium]
MSDTVESAYLRLQDVLDGSEKCVEDPDMWMENWTGRSIPLEVAQRLCKGCHAIEECAAYAILAEEEFGIWGGTTPQSRKAGEDV